MLTKSQPSFAETLRTFTDRKLNELFDFYAFQSGINSVPGILKCRAIQAEQDFRKRTESHRVIRPRLVKTFGSKK